MKQLMPFLIGLAMTVCHCEFSAAQDPDRISLDLEGLSVEEFDNGYNALSVHYRDKNGNAVYTINYDQDGVFEDNPSGYAIIQRKFNEKHQVTEKRYFDQFRKPFRFEDGPAIERYYYDTRNQLTKLEFLDEHGDKLTDGLATIIFSYDKFGNLAEESTYDHFEQLVDGISTVRYTYDSMNLLIEERRLDKSGHLFQATEGHAITEYKYDKQKRRVEKIYKLNENILADGISNVRYYYPPDASSKVELVYYDKSGTELKREKKNIKEVFPNE
jgi:YD repeat-containing protein